MRKKIKDQIAPEGFVFIREGSIETLADNIQQISSAVKRWDTIGKINRKALVLLIKEGTKSYGTVVDEKDVSKVLDSLASLEDRLINRKKK